MNAFIKRAKQADFIQNIYFFSDLNVQKTEITVFNARKVLSWQFVTDDIEKDMKWDTNMTFCFLKSLVQVQMNMLWQHLMEPCPHETSVSCQAGPAYLIQLFSFYV